jgi:D-alanyl-D-alanine carboxypeptidase (penicillin-binding protein 5/6)
MKGKPAFFSCLWALGVILFVLPASVQARYLPDLISNSAVVIDVATGTVVYTKNPYDEIPPASLTKLMTAHLALSEIKANRAYLDEIVSLPRESWAVNQPPLSSLMGLANGHRVSLRDLLLGMAIFSGNDAATAVALRFAPSVNDFAEMMTQEAVSMGLKKTRFVDASGYSENNMTTAREFTEFCRIYVQTHPESLNDFNSVKEFAYPMPENVAEQYRDNPRTTPSSREKKTAGALFIAFKIPPVPLRAGRGSRPGCWPCR